MKYVELGGISFEEHKSKMHPVAPITGCNRDEIFDHYDRPSNTKISIWNDWCDWCDKMNRLGFTCGIEISGHNCNFFTITGSVRKDDEVLHLWITASHNRLYHYN